MDSNLIITKTNKAKFLYSREALLEHLAESEQQLSQKVSKFGPQEPAKQEMLILKYLALQDNLAQLKEIALRNKAGDNHQEVQQESDEKWDNKAVTEELRQLLNNFNNFLKNSGFLTT